MPQHQDLNMERRPRLEQRWNYPQQRLDDGYHGQGSLHESRRQGDCVRIGFSETNMSEKIDIARLYREFEEALTDFVAASLTVDDDPAVILPRRARLAKARERLCSHPDVEQAKYDRIVLKAWDMKRWWK